MIRRDIRNLDKNVIENILTTKKVQREISKGRNLALG